MKIVKRLCGQRHISLSDMANLLAIPVAYAVLAANNNRGFDKERLAIASFFGYLTWYELEKQNGGKNHETHFIMCEIPINPKRTIIDRLKTRIFYEYDGCWYVEDIFLEHHKRQQFFNREEAKKYFLCKEELA